MKNYVINANTLAIIPCDNNMSLVYEGENMFIIDSKPNNIINKNCIRNGSTLNGKKKSTENITGSNYKVPILVSEEDKIIFFPTSSPRLKSVSWLNLTNIDKTYYNIAKKVSVVVFYNAVMIELNVSLNIINNQILKATRLEHNLRRNRA